MAKKRHWRGLLTHSAENPSEKMPKAWGFAGFRLKSNVSREDFIMVQQTTTSKKPSTKKKTAAKFAPVVIAAEDKKRILAALAKSRNTTHELQLARCVEGGRLYEQVTM